MPLEADLKRWTNLANSNLDAIAQRTVVRAWRIALRRADVLPATRKPRVPPQEQEECFDSDPAGAAEAAVEESAKSWKLSIATGRPCAASDAAAGGSMECFPRRCVTPSAATQRDDLPRLSRRAS